MIVYANEIKNNSEISSNGVAAPTASIIGGSSGGGSINLFYKTNYENKGKIIADGGNKNYNLNSSGPGGNGSISIGKILNEIYNETYSGVTKVFNYTGSSQEFQIKQNGYYKIQCWGAKGGCSLADGNREKSGGKGGYTSGIIYLNKGEKIYVYVGKKGEDATRGKDSKGGYNGGGLGTWDNRDDEAAGAGGGATDIRLVSGDWNNFESLKSRIMVAAGGAGASWKTEGGAGGGLIGLTNRAIALPGTQTGGYKFGIGQDGYGTGNSDGVAGAGGGYYGGTTNDYADNEEAGAGGSSYISGYDGCDAISEESTENHIVHTGQSIHYSNKKFINAEILDGLNKVIDENDDGYAKIRFLGIDYDVAMKENENYNK